MALIRTLRCQTCGEMEMMPASPSRGGPDICRSCREKRRSEKLAEAHSTYCAVRPEDDVEEIFLQLRAMRRMLKIDEAQFLRLCVQMIGEEAR